MKILCDVCGKEEAAMFCCADEAALCDPCDRRVHRANKLAGKHCRFSLLSPSSSNSPSPQSHPLCDVCQEKRGFVFCQEDRAILCRDCDGPIHSANHLTMKHNRFLLTGVRLSSAPIYSSSSSSEAEEVVADKNANNHSKSLPKTNQDQALAAAAADDSVLCSSYSSITASATAAAAAEVPPTTSNSSSGSGSSISDYLIKMCPGWCVEDLLVDDAAAAAAIATDGFSKLSTVDGLLPFLEAELEGGGLEAVAEEFPTWVPHVRQVPPPDLLAVPAAAVQYQPWARAAGRVRWSDDAITVPEIAPAASNPGKRPRQHSLSYF